MKKGFTLIELLIVTGIISILITSGTFVYARIGRNARVTRVIGDLKKIETAFNLWRADNGRFLNENTYFNGTDNNVCNGATGDSDEPRISQLDLAQRLPSSPANWRGPYFSEIRFLDPWGIEYMYDNDNDTYTAVNWEGGVNIQMGFCNNAQKTTILTTDLDRVIDNSDGATAGKIRWDTQNSYYLLAPAANQ